MAKRKQKNDTSDSPKVKKQKNNVTLEPVITSDAPVERQTKWKNKQRVLVFSSRGISYRTRHLMNDLRTLMPHSKAEPKMERKDKLFIINEICEMKNCNKCLYFEGKKKQDVYLWASNVPKGPSVKFLVENIHTMSELKLTGNCLKGSRPILSFDKAFNSDPHWMLLKELFVQIFGTPNHHPKSQPFIDHVFSFSIHDNRIWFRNYQILAEDGSLAEIGPRFVLNPIRIFGSSFGGATLYQNPFYVSPNEFRRTLRQQKAGKYNQRQEAKVSQILRKPEMTYRMDPTDDVFNTLPEKCVQK
ncbi:Ribosome biogenesis protein BRX1 [Bulinus truncatus]|nr:Ribosome biogenesis protein BRX1 [Bulinus truncatus]